MEARTDIFCPDSSALSHSVVGGGVVVVRYVRVIRFIFQVLQLLPIRFTK